MKKLNITFCSFPDFSGNAKALYDYMVKRYKDNMNYTWVVYDEKTVDKLKEKGINSVLIGTKKFDTYIPKTNVFFTTHANLTGEKSKCKKAIYIELWHGIGPKPVGFLTNNLSRKDSEWYDSLSENLDYIITTSPLFNAIFSASFRVKPSRILNLGLPLLDEIVYSNGVDNLKKLFGNNILNYDKYIFYAPTFKKGCGRKLESHYNESNILNLKRYDEKKLIEYLHRNNYLLFIKYHPSDEIRYNKINDSNILYIDNRILKNSELNINEILNAFDLLITDYSSLGTEFSFLDKPVIYLSTDYAEYANNRGIILNDYNFWTDSNLCNNLALLLKMLNEQIGKKRVAANKKEIFSDLVDGGCKQICDYFFNNNYKLNSYIGVNKSKVLEMEKYNEDLIQKLLHKDEIIKNQIERIKYLEEKEQELASIKYSRSYKIVQKFNNIRMKVVKK